MGEKTHADAVIVGARCAGSTLAIALAREGLDVTVIDRATFPSDTVSTHFLYPNTLARLEQLGVMDRLRAMHDVPLVASRIRAFGHVFEGRYTGVDGYELAAGPRRRALDTALLETARAAGATIRLGERVAGLIGSGSEEDPACGVRLANGEEIRAPWVFGADGRGSIVSKGVGAEKTQPLAGNMAAAYAYWHGIPTDGFATLDVQAERVLTSYPIEDGLHMLTVMLPPAAVRGTPAQRKANYLAALQGFPQTLDARTLDGAELATEVTIAPETLLRGFFRRASGAGWALVGDACHFKHPATAQGICDAIEQALWLADALVGGRGFDGYAAWRDERAAEHYEWSFTWGRFPRPERAEPLFRGFASDEGAAQDFRDSFSRLVEPSQVMRPERLERWFSAPAGASV